MSNMPSPHEGTVDRWGDDVGRTALGREAAHLVPFGGRMSRDMERIAEDLGAEDQVEQRMVTELGSDLRNQPAPEAAGVDLSVIGAVDPQFDDFTFRTIARETFNRVREARTTERVDEADALLSPKMEAELRQAVSGDVAAHRHHLLPGLAIQDATITAAAVTGGREVIDVLLSVAGEELERDNATAQLVAGDSTVRRWSEHWRFERDPSLDSSASDLQHTMRFGDGWCVAHRGWVVTQIERLPDPPPAAA